MNIRRIIREESNDMEWIKDQDPSNIHIRNLEIGMVVMVECKNFFPFLKNREFTVDEITESYREGEICVHFKEMSKIKYPFGEDREPTIPGMNMCEHLGCSFKLIKDINEIIKEEIDDFDWIRDIKATPLNSNEQWILVNDIDRENREEGKEIQKYLFDHDYKWGTHYEPHQRLRNFCINAIYHYPLNSGRMLYHDGCRDAEVSMTNKDIQKEEYKVFYWSDLKPTSIKEEMDNSLDWISDVKSNQDIAQEIADKSEIKDDGLHTPFLPSRLLPIPFSISPPLLFPSIYSLPPQLLHTFFTDYCEEQYGLSFKESKDIWERYMVIIKDKIKINNLNESNDMDWIKDTLIPNEYYEFLEEAKDKYGYGPINNSDVDIILGIKKPPTPEDIDWAWDYKRYLIDYFAETEEYPIEMVEEWFKEIYSKGINESNELQWIENTLPSLVDELDFALEGSNFHVYLHPQLNTIDIINQYRNVVYRVGYNSATSRRPIRTIGEFYQAVKDGFGSSHNARLSIYPDAMDDLKTLLREYIYKKMLNESDMDWIKKVPTEARVTLDNWYTGMKVKLNPNSIFGHQSSGTGIIIDNDYYMGWCDNDDEESSDEECGWIRVGWENNELGFEGNYQNEYRIGPHRHDLLIDLDDINESNDMDWIKDVEPDELTASPDVFFRDDDDMYMTLDGLGYDVTNMTEMTMIELAINYGYRWSDKHDGWYNRDEVANFRDINESDDMDWIKDVNDPWEGIGQQVINKLTEDERNLIEGVFESDKREWAHDGCDPTYKITGVTFEEDSSDEEMLIISFEVTCENGSKRGVWAYTFWIDRETLEWDIS